MILTQTLASLSLALCMAGNNGQEQKAPQISKASGPMSPFERLTSGEWRMKSTGGSEFFETWRYGPGGHSVCKFTHGVNLHDNNRPWREVEVFYWNPWEKKVNLLGFSPYMAGVSRGAVGLHPDRLEIRLDLNQGGRIRILIHKIEFHGKDKFQETLFESVNGQPYVAANQWNHVWSKAVTPVPVLNSPETPKPTGAQSILAAFAGKAWEEMSSNRTTASCWTEFEWIPYANVMSMRSSSMQNKVGRQGQYDLYLYQLPSTLGVQAFALFSDGSYGGGSVVAKGGRKIEVRLKMRSNVNLDRVISYVIGPNDSLEEAAWKVGKGSKTLIWNRVSSPVKSS